MLQARPALAGGAQTLGIMLRPDETKLIGHWSSSGATVVGDATCQRIDRLIAKDLLELARTPDGWSTLLQDPRDGRLWELTYPLTHMHGGGPPSLAHLSADLAKLKYGSWSSTPPTT